MIAIVLVNWNGHYDTVECLESLMRLNAKACDFRIIVSDNMSNPGSIEHIVAWCEGLITIDRMAPAWSSLPVERCHDPDYQVVSLDELKSFVDAPMITILRNGSNLGFAGGNNTAIRLALTDQSVEAIWLLNNDTICRHDALDGMVARMREDSSLGLLGSTLVYYDEPLKVQGLGGWFDGRIGRGDHIGKFLDLGGLPSRSDVEGRLTYVIGASMLVSRCFLEEVGLMEECYFLYFEEVDWSERNAGRFHLGWEPTSIVYHKEGASIGTSLRRRASNTSIYYINRSLLVFTWKYYRKSMPIIVMRVLMRSIRFLAQSDISGACIVLKAFRGFLVEKMYH